MPRPIQATIHTAALSHNLARARQSAPDAKVWAIDKANAYGHGIERAFDGLKSADGFALLDFDEAEKEKEIFIVDENLSMNFVSYNFLIQTKLKAARPKDLWDIEQLEKIRKNKNK